MADQDISIRVSVEGEEKGLRLNDYFKGLKLRIIELDNAVRSGKVSADAALKTYANWGQMVKAQFDKGNVGLKEYNDLSAKLRTVTGHGVTGFQTMSRSLAGMQSTMTSAQTAAFSFGNIIQDSSQFSMGFAQGIRAIGNNITQMTQQMIYLTTQAGSATLALKTLFSVMAGPAGVLLAISLITTLATVFADKLFPSVEKTGETLDRLREVLYKLGDRTQQERLGDLAKQMERLAKAARDAEEVGWFRRIMAGVPGVGLLAFIGTEGLEARLKAEEGRLALQERADTDRIKAMDKQIAQEDLLDKARAEDRRRAEENRQADFLWGRWMLDMAQKLRAFRPAPEEGIPIPGPVPSGDPNIVKRNLAEIQVSFGELWAMNIAKLGGFQTAWVSSMRAMGAAVSDGIGRAFARTFNGINSLFEIMVVNFAQAVAQMLVEAAALAFLQYLFPGAGTVVSAGSALVPRASGGYINEPVVGRGMRTGSVYTLAERGPEYVVPTYKMAGGYGPMAGGSKQVIQIIGRVRGQDLVYSVDKTNRNRNAKLLF